MTKGNNMNITYQVWDRLWNDYSVFQTEQQARDWIAKQVDNYPGSDYKDFKIYKREELD